MAECLEFALLWEWHVLLDTLDKEKRVTYRQILAVHTSTCCSPGHLPRMVPSLKDAGLDSPWEAAGVGHVVLITLDAVHEGQKNESLKPVTFEAREPTALEAQEQVCKTALAYFLSIGADQVRLHPNTLKHGQSSVTVLRAAGHKVSEAAGPPATGTWRHWMQQFPAVTAIEPVLTPTGPQKQDIDEKVVIEALLRLLPKKHDRHDPSRFPLPLRQILEQNLPKKGLKAFLVAHSDHFEVHDEGCSKQWTLSIKPAAPTTGCDDHQPGSSSSGPPPVPTAPASGCDDQQPGSSSSGPPPVPTAPASGCGGMPGSSADPSPRRPPTPPPPPPPGLVGGETQWVNQPLPSHNPGWSWHDDWRGWTGWTDESNWSGGWQQRDEQQEKQALRAELVREGLLEPEALTVGTPWPPNVNAWQ